MKLHRKEYHASCDLNREIQKIVNDYLSDNETFTRIQGYIKLANDNLKKVEMQVKRNNSFYEHCTFKSFSFDKSSLLTSSYEIQLYFKDKYDNGKFAYFDVGTLIILLDECELIED